MSKHQGREMFVPRRLAKLAGRMFMKCCFYVRFPLQKGKGRVYENIWLGSGKPLQVPPTAGQPPPPPLLFGSVALRTLLIHF